MKNFNILILYFTLLSVFSFGQNTTRVFYEFSYPAKAGNDSIVKKNTIAILDIDSDKSVYRDYYTVAQDSTLRTEAAKSKLSNENINKKLKPPKFTYKVTKYPKSKEILYTERILKNNFEYNEIPKLNWKILSETTKIEKYKVQKATVNYGGRNWVAWFASEIPFSDGPYKFGGLPGLILKLEDDTQSFSWNLSGLKKIETPTESLFDKSAQGKPVIVTKVKFLEVYKNYLENPLSIIFSSMTDTDLGKTLPSGKTVRETIREQEPMMKKLLSDTSNNIEILK